jgi:hypothetical protein
VRVFVRAKQVKDTQVPELSMEIAREIENEMQYPGMIKVTVIRETTATATAPAQIAAVLETNRRRASGGEHEDHRAGSITVGEHDAAPSVPSDGGAGAGDDEDEDGGSDEAADVEDLAADELSEGDPPSADDVRDSS